MARLLDKLPIINIWSWANGSEYTIEDDTTVLPAELMESDRKTDEDYANHFKARNNKGNSGKGKTQFKVEKEQLNMDRVHVQKEIVAENEREER